MSTIAVSGGLVLLLSTFLAWENHPKVKYRAGAHPEYYIAEVRHTMGLATIPAGIITIALAVLSLALARRLRSLHLPSGWFAFLLAFASLGVTSVEIAQLLLGRRNWQDHLSAKVVPLSLSHAVGSGAWLAFVASVVLVVNTSVYLWRGYRTPGRDFTPDQS